MTHPVPIVSRPATGHRPDVVPMTVLVESFEQDPAVVGQQMRGLLDRGRGSFLAEALDALRRPSETRGYRFLVTLLVTNDLLLDCLLDRSLGVPELAALARTAASVNPKLDAWLAERLAEAAASCRWSDAGLARLMEVLSDVAGGLRAVHLLNPFLADPNPRVRSKAALLIGKANRSASWAEKQLGSADARVRANAVEALWSADAGYCRAVFLNAARDGNCRVAGNGALGLYRLGDAEAVAALLGMARHRLPEFRASAAWCIGETQDPRFLPVLQELVRESGGRVRQNALRSIARLRQQAARITEAGRLRVEIVPVERGGGITRLRLAVAAEGEGETAALPATSFVFHENGNMVERYTVEESVVPETLIVGFAIPRRSDSSDRFRALAEQGFRDCLIYRRHPDHWAVWKYPERPPAAAQGGLEAAAPRYLADGAALTASMSAPGTRTGGILEACAALIRAAVLMRGVRHVILVEEPGAPPLADWSVMSELLTTARAARVALHVVAPPESGNTALGALAAGTGGRYLQPSRIEEIPECMMRLCLGVLARYEAVWTPAAGAAGDVRLQVWCDQGYGEAGVTLPAAE